MVQHPLPPGSARSRAFFGAFLARASRAEEALAVLEEFMAPDCRVHSQNGDIQTPAQSRAQSFAARSVFPDLMVEVDHVLFPDDRVIVQLRMTGSVPPGTPFLAPGPFTSLGSVVGLVDQDLQLQELWPYLNPGFAFSYPPSGLAEAPPPPDGAGAAEARALYDSWVHAAEAGTDFITAVGATFAPDGVVHPGNGDVGRVDALHKTFAAVVRGLPDLSLSIDDAIVCDGRVVVQFSMSGRHDGLLGLYPPTGRVLPSRGMLVGRANRQGLLAELWVYIAPGYSITFPPQAEPERGG